MRVGNLFLVLCVSGLGAIGCASERLDPDARKSDVAGGVSAETATKAEVAAKPVDRTPVALGVPGERALKAANMQKAPPLRKATVDEIEVLNETFRTEGSRETIRQRIEKARNATDRQRLIAYYNSVVVRNLSPAELSDAQAKLSATLARVQPTSQQAILAGGSTR